MWNLQVNVASYKTRPTAKDFIQVEIVVEKNSQKIILIGKVSPFLQLYEFLIAWCLKEPWLGRVGWNRGLDLFGG